MLQEIIIIKKKQLHTYLGALAIQLPVGMVTIETLNIYTNLVAWTVQDNSIPSDQSESSILQSRIARLLFFLKGTWPYSIYLETSYEIAMFWV